MGVNLLAPRGPPSHRVRGYHTIFQYPMSVERGVPLHAHLLRHRRVAHVTRIVGLCALDALNSHYQCRVAPPILDASASPWPLPASGERKGNLNNLLNVEAHVSMVQVGGSKDISFGIGRFGTWVTHGRRLRCGPRSDPRHIGSK